MPAWLLIVCAGVGAVLVFSEIVVRMVTALRIPTDSQNLALLADARSRLDLVRGAVEDAREAWQASPPTPSDVARMQAGFRAIESYLPADPTPTRSAGDGGWLGTLLSGVTRQNVFLGVGLVLLLIPALIAGGFSVGFDRLSDTPAPSATPTP